MTTIRKSDIPERPGPFVEVEWVDSAGHGEWHDPQDAVDALGKVGCRSAGYLLADDERGIVIVLGTGAIGQHLSSMAIPRQAILAVHRLRGKS